MNFPFHNRWKRLGGPERFWLSTICLYLPLWLLKPESIWTRLLAAVVVIGGLVVAIRLLKKFSKALVWRLRNRLIVAYLFIGLVPILLIVSLAGLAAYALMGQVAIYLVSSELERRTTTVLGPAQLLASSPPERRAPMLPTLLPFLRSRLPDLKLLIRSKDEFRDPKDAVIEPPPSGWGTVSGLVIRDRTIFGWAHAKIQSTEVTMIAPLPHDVLGNLMPGLGEVFFLGYQDPPGSRKAIRLPAPVNRVDVELTWISPITVSRWENPGQTESAVLIVRSRPSAVLRAVFGQKVEWAQSVLFLAIGIVSLFVIVELVALFAGISITRTITGAVHDLYDGTQRIQQGDFSHRIPVKGTDQLAELSRSFNGMTSNLERLIVVEKEQERLQSELEIAREVQRELFPKEVPFVRGLQLTGVCNPARVVSGDYYDFLAFREQGVAMAIGDVAGKGISAALLMASIQSIMRTQLADGHSFSASRLVSRLNQQLFANTSPEKYATFFFGTYDDAVGELTYTNAGHLPPILVRNNHAELLEVTGTVVGAFPGVEFGENTIALKPGDLLVGYTDGITEPENEYGEMFGEERLQDLVVKYRDVETPELVARIMEGVTQWTGSPEQQDDMTLLVVRRV